MSVQDYRFATSQIPCHAYPIARAARMTMLESKDDDRGVNEASLFLGLGFKKMMGTFKLLFSYTTEELTVIKPQETGK